MVHPFQAAGDKSPETIPSLKLTAFSHLKVDGWNMIVSFLEPGLIFRGFGC